MILHMLHIFAETRHIALTLSVVSISYNNLDCHYYVFNFFPLFFYFIV